MYYEDVDLCFKARKAGYKVVYTHESMITHLEGKSTDSRQVIGSLNEQSRLIFFKKWAPFILQELAKDAGFYANGKSYTP